MGPGLLLVTSTHFDSQCHSPEFIQLMINLSGCPTKDIHGHARLSQSVKSGTIRESNQALGVRKAHYA